MPAELPTKDIEAADAAVAFAQQVRRFHRRRSERRAPQRVTDIDNALKRIAAAMGPLRSAIGRFPYGPQTAVAEANRQRIREASAALQRERRKLFKMRVPPQPPEDLIDA
jgi:type VI protein secretion system component VasF